MSNPEDIERAKQGKEAWNVWANDNPYAKGDFSGETLDINFDGFIFPGEADFADVQFGFEASFERAEFGGTTSFSGAKFTYASFSSACFRGSVSFSGAKFEGDALFGEAKFGGDGNFSAVQVSGSIEFDLAKFSCDVVFNDAQFSKNAVFTSVQILGDAMFLGALFSSHATFARATMNSALFSGATFFCTPDFTQAELKFTPSFQGVAFHFVDDHPLINYALRLRKLKLLAIEGCDHEMEVAFFAREMRAKRRDELINPYEKAGNFLYDWFSFYGTSILRPFIGLLTVFVLFFKFNHLIPTQYCASKLPDLLHMTLTNLLPIPSGLKSSQTAIINCLYGSVDTIPRSIMFLATIEEVLGTVFVFLILLGIRNRFKIK